ncbi:hypothetical protein [Sulfitobacter sp. CW3]|nr:hypothetical protein [Sulfitobacter sp. CW3]
MSKTTLLMGAKLHGLMFSFSADAANVGIGWVLLRDARLII